MITFREPINYENMEAIYKVIAHEDGLAIVATMEGPLRFYYIEDNTNAYPDNSYAHWMDIKPICILQVPQMIRIEQKYRRRAIDERNHG